MVVVDSSVSSHFVCHFCFDTYVCTDFRKTKSGFFVERLKSVFVIRMFESIRVQVKLKEQNIPFCFLRSTDSLRINSMKQLTAVVVVL